MNNTEGPDFFVPMSNVTGVVRSPYEYPQYYLADRSVFQYLAAYMFFLIITGFPINSMMIRVTVQHHKIRTPINYLLLNLAVADLIMVVGGHSSTLYAFMDGYFYLGVGGCYIDGFIFSLAYGTLLWTLAVLAVERWVVVCKPFKTFRFGWLQAVLGVCFSWLWAFSRAIPPLLGWSRYIPEGLQCSCGVDYYTIKPDIENESFIIYLYTIHFFIPLIVICICISLVLCKGNNTVATEDQKEAAKQANQRELTHTVIAMFLVFLICCVPYAAITLYIFIHGNVFQPIFITAISFLAKTSTICYPLVYVGINQQFRECFMKTLRQETEDDEYTKKLEI